MVLNQNQTKFNLIHWVFLFIIILISFGLRWYQLDIRAITHDESLHGMYGLYFFEDKVNNFYKYNPLLHGPALYHLLPWSYWMLGISKFALRAPMAMIGCFLVISPLFFKRFLGNWITLLAIAIIGTSPTLIYWSRYTRHDPLVLLSLFLILLSFSIRHGPLKAFLFFIGISFHFSVKENSYLHLILFLAFMTYESLINKFLKLREKTSWSLIINYTRNNLLWVFLAALIGGLLYAYFYSAAFLYPQGILDGLYRKSLVYWFQQHQVERIPGPFSYNFLINFFYESWWVPFLSIYFFIFYKERSWLLKVGLFTSIVIAAMTHFLYKDHFSTPFLSQVLKIKIPFDLYLFFPLVFHAVASTTIYLIEKKRLLAILSYGLFSSLFTYCYVGEKVPWLAVYPLIMGILFFVVYLKKTLSLFLTPLLFLLLFFNLYKAYQVNIKDPGSKTHLISQVHTSPAYEEMGNKLRSELLSFDNGLGPKILVLGNNTWPMTWFLHGRSEYHYNRARLPLEHYQYILTESSDLKMSNKLKGKFRKKFIPFRWWWLPQYKKMGPVEAIRYYLFFENWNPSGGSQSILWQKL
jgi:uncharacterized protein (TIGR03663 family)